MIRGVQVNLQTREKKEVVLSPEEEAAWLAQAENERKLAEQNQVRAAILQLESQQNRALRELAVAQAFPGEISVMDVERAKNRLLEIERAIRVERAKLAG